MSSAIVSLLPRGADGSSTLVALDLASLEPTAVRPIPPNMYLDDGRTAPVEHCRGLAFHGGDLWVALFNCVRRYSLVDASTLVLEDRGLLTHPQGADIHGLTADDRTITAVSTGAGALVSWQHDSSRKARVVRVDRVDRRPDLRFPRSTAQAAGHLDWRQAMPAQLHLNDVYRVSDAYIVCGLDRLITVTAAGCRPLVHRPGSILHGGLPLPDGSLAVTNAVTGSIELFALADGAFVACWDVADPTAWFVRGLAVWSDLLITLRSAIIPQAERRVTQPNRSSRRPSTGSSSFGISIVDRHTGAILAEQDLVIDGAGAVAYAAVVPEELPTIRDGRRRQELIAA
jgi:hypothetical protein